MKMVTSPPDTSRSNTSTLLEELKPPQSKAARSTVIPKDQFNNLAGRAEELFPTKHSQQREFLDLRLRLLRVYQAIVRDPTIRKNYSLYSSLVHHLGKSDGVIRNAGKPPKSFARAQKMLSSLESYLSVCQEHKGGLQARFKKLAREVDRKLGNPKDREEILGGGWGALDRLFLFVKDTEERVRRIEQGLNRLDTGLFDKVASILEEAFPRRLSVVSFVQFDTETGERITSQDELKCFFYHQAQRVFDQLPQGLAVTPMDSLAPVQLAELTKERFVRLCRFLTQTVYPAQDLDTLCVGFNEIEREELHQLAASLMVWMGSTGFSRTTFLPLAEAVRQEVPSISLSLEKLCEANLRLIRSVVRKKLTQWNHRLSEVIPEGSLGIMIALRRFAPEMGNRFSTLAHNWIVSVLNENLPSVDAMVPLPRDLRAKASAFHKLQLPENPDLLRLDEGVKTARHLTELDTQLLERLRRNGLLRTTLPSLDQEQRGLNGENRSPLREYLADPDNLDPVQDLDHRERIAAAMSALSNVLNERERDIITYRFGLSGNPEQTLKELAMRHGISRERVRVIEGDALKKLRSDPALGKLARDPNDTKILKLIA